MMNSVDPDQTAHMSRLIWVNAVFSILEVFKKVWQLFAADDIFRCIFVLGTEWLSWSHTLATNCLVIELMLQEM